MAHEKEKERTEVGIIVGRFQVDELTEGHKDLVDSVLDMHKRVIIFLGVSPLKVTMNNPLDIEARKTMLTNIFKENIEVHYVKDQMEDEVWSELLDERIGDLLGARQKATLYGSRDSFISHYKGKHQTVELVPDVITNGTDVRKQISIKTRRSANFRAGVIWSTQNRYPVSYTTIDVAIFNDDYTKVLLGRKKHESNFRFIGGFVEPGDTLETTVRKEANEETGLEVDGLKYVGSYSIDDWRYRGEQDKIMTTLFTAKKVFGREAPNDDIHQLKWFTVEDIKEDDLVENHKVLFRAIFPEKQ
jgi:bifunctional NMN adenylyltransferase/nudix hydrolase